MRCAASAGSSASRRRTRRSVVEQHRFSLFQSLVAGNVDYGSDGARAEHRIVSIAEFRQAALEAAEFSVVERIVKAESDAIAAELNLDPLPNAFGSTILRCLPALSASLRATVASTLF